MRGKRAWLALGEAPDEVDRGVRPKPKTGARVVRNSVPELAPGARSWTKIGSLGGELREGAVAEGLEPVPRSCSGRVRRLRPESGDHDLVWTQFAKLSFPSATAQVRCWPRFLAARIVVGVLARA